MRYKWNKQKNIELKKIRGFNFDDVLEQLSKGEILQISEHPNKKKYPNQYIITLLYNNYVCLIPFVYESEEVIFLKTVYYSRKANKKLNV